MRKRELEGLVGRVRQARRANAAGAASDPADPRVAGAQDGAAPDRIAALEARVAHLEHLLEGFQDSVYRESERHDKLISDLQTQVEPGAMGASLAEDARNRGL
jgi:uncharacterized coiled-coil protein SlyX